MRVLIAWWWCAICYRFVLYAPVTRLWWAALPNAGTYANLTFQQFRDWRAGKQWWSE